jgi:hypothetical protein
MEDECDGELRVRFQAARHEGVVRGMVAPSGKCPPDVMRRVTGGSRHGEGCYVLGCFRVYPQSDKGMSRLIQPAPLYTLGRV